MIPIKVLQHGFKLVRASANASAFDIVTPVDFVLTKGCRVDIKLGLKSQIPTGYVGLMAPRSGLGSKGVQVRNTVAFMDSDFRGEWEARLTLANWAEHDSMSFKRGERIIQVCFPTLDTVVEYVDEVDETERGEGGFNSTGTGLVQVDAAVIQELRRVIPRAVIQHTLNYCHKSKMVEITISVYHAGSKLTVHGKPLEKTVYSSDMYALPESSGVETSQQQYVARAIAQVIPKLIKTWKQAE